MCHPMKDSLWPSKHASNIIIQIMFTDSDTGDTWHRMAFHPSPPILTNNFNNLPAWFELQAIWVAVICP